MKLVIIFFGVVLATAVYNTNGLIIHIFLFFYLKKSAQNTYIPIFFAEGAVTREVYQHRTDRKKALVCE